MATCFFIGHREAPESLREPLAREVERHIVEYGVTDFVVGCYGWFDAMAARAVRNAKKRHPEVTLYLLTPYYRHDKPIELPDDYDGTFYPPGMETVPKRVAIIRANRYMVDHSDFLIAYVWRTASNARDLVEYAQRRERKGLIAVVNLDVERS